MGVYIRVKNKRLYLDVYSDGRRVWEKLDLKLTGNKIQNKEIMRLAEICRSKRETRALENLWEIPKTGNKKIRLAEYIERNIKSASLKTFVFQLGKYDPDILLADIDSAWAAGFFEYLKKETRGGTPNQYATALSSVLRAAVKNGDIKTNPCDDLELPKKHETDIVFYNAGELRLLAATPIPGEINDEIRKPFLFSCFTGLRVSDLRALRWSDIDTGLRQIIKRQEKTGDYACVPMNGAAWAIIDTGGKSGNVFKWLSSAPHRGNYVHLRKWRDAAGIGKSIGWHTARRTFATLTLENGADIYTVSKLLGHRSIRQVAKYARVTDRLRRAAVAALPDIRLST